MSIIKRAVVLVARGGPHRSVALAVAMILAAAMIAVLGPPGAAVASGSAPNLIGSYSEHDVCTSCGGSAYDWSWQITNEDFSTGSFSGTSSYAGEPGTLTGTVAGTSITMTDARVDGYTWYPKGALASDCSMSGTWTDNLGQSGTWQATPESGHCGAVATVTTVTSSANPAAAGSPVTFTATVNPAPTGGTVSFSDYGVPIPGCQQVPLSGASATCPRTYPAAGAHGIEAAYSGTNGFAASTTLRVLTEIISKTPCATLAYCDLSGVDLSGADLAGAEIYGANLKGTNLSGTILDGANLNGANLNGANLSGASLIEARLLSANLNGANLPGADLARADLFGANLNRANLTNADLTDANLLCANTNGANFTGANLTGTTFGTSPFCG
jgi:uncharacterized protein YjbI with pentapeptide repeats